MRNFAELYAIEIDAIVKLTEASLTGNHEGEQLEALRARLADPESSRFAKLTRMLGLKRPECDLLLCLIAHHVQPHLDTAIRKRSTLPYVHEALVREIFRQDRMPIYTSDSALNLWQLVRARDMGPGAPMAFDIDLAVIEWLAGKPGLEPALQQLLTRVEGQAADDGIACDLAQAIRAEGSKVHGIICELTGSSETDFTEVAAGAASMLNTSLWVVQAREEPFDPDQVLRIHRFVTVQNAALYWQAPESRHLEPCISPSARLQFIANAESQPARTSATHRYLSFEVPAPRRNTLRKRLRAHFPDAPEDKLRRVAAIRGVDARLIETAQSSDIDALARHALTRSTRALHAWAMPLSTDVGFDDLVLDPPMREQLEDLVAQIRIQHELMDRPEVARVYVQERALSILLQGPPGTGKTLSARVLAGEAGLPLFRVDVASLVSKWRGETNKNLREMFRAATRSGAILFVDEFDAVASKRTETRNEVARADNQNTAYFLQLIENAYEGTVVFATNRPKEIDEAMLRRIRHTLDFQPPGESERTKLWRLALAPFEPAEDLLAFSEVLGPAFSFSGARIKAVVLNAYAQGAASGDDALTIDGLRRATLAEARQNGRLPGKRELSRVLSYCNSEIRAVQS
ncbi:ATP-binding protein [Halomonas stenophila]|uniref:AAA+ superfamily predicted ATPase n=1 Tax=Halomonas stenophila TaxID=795312 RepID=A0A7W5EVJ9_9GAMM|nr:ATP-binding protein [Halomonas stenophila]MBB3232249.1 AAA+ superfamily predicted ATPase [Halomonas stenophila]